MLNDFPTKGQEREDKIIQYVKNNNIEYNFTKIISEDAFNKIEILVFEDALKIDGIRVNVSAKTQQTIADLLRCILPTAKIYDLMWHFCEHKTTPKPRQISLTTQAMIEHSQKIDKELESMGSPTGLKSTVGKTWILDNKLKYSKNKACNYGWHFDGPSFKGIKGNINASMLKNPKTNKYWKLIQPASTCHNDSHSDYSQVCILISRQCWVNGQEKDILDVLKDKELAPLLNHDGILNITRQPNVPEENPIVNLPFQNEPKIKYENIIPEDDTLKLSNKILITLPSPKEIEKENTKLQIIDKTPNNIFTLFMSIINMIISLIFRK